MQSPVPSDTDAALGTTPRAGSLRNGLLRRLVLFGALTLLIVTAISLFAGSWWIADLIANLRVQWFILIIATCLGAIRLRHRVSLIIPGGLLIWYGAELSTGFLSEQHSAQPVRLRLCLFNVLTRNQQHDAVITQLKSSQADVLAVLELSESLAEKIERELRDEYPFVVKEPHDFDNFGIGVYSRSPITASEILRQFQNDVPTIDVLVERDDGAVRILATHPLPPMSAGAFRARNDQLTWVAARVRKLKSDQPTIPVIVTGDLNLTPWSPVFRRFTASSGLRNASEGTGFTPTWYRWPGFPFGLMLDHALCSDDLCGRRTQVLDAAGSDHRAVLFEFRAAE